MNPREFFNAVAEMRKYQRAYERSGRRDRLAQRCAKDAEARIDKEIARVRLVLKEEAQPRLDI